MRKPRPFGVVTKILYTPLAFVARDVKFRDPQTTGNPQGMLKSKPAMKTVAEMWESKNEEKKKTHATRLDTTKKGSNIPNPSPVRDVRKG